MDYGSIYGMGSHFGEDYTAQCLVRLGRLTQDNIAQARFGKPFAALGDEKAAARAAMQQQLQGAGLAASALSPERRRVRLLPVAAVIMANGKFTGRATITKDTP